MLVGLKDEHNDTREDGNSKEERRKQELLQTLELKEIAL